MTTPFVSAQHLGLVACHACGLVHRASHTPGMQCARCGTRLYSRKPNSMAHTWALLIAALIFYFPANLLPIMRTRSLFGMKEDTILSGITYFWQSGSHILAAIIFIASVAVPLFKLGVLAFLAFSVHAKSRWQPRQRAKLYRLIKAIGHWSMLDIFVLMLTITLMQLRSLAVVSAGPGALAFALVVILTMVASMQFDARLIWDTSASSQPDHGHSTKS